MKFNSECKKCGLMKSTFLGTGAPCKLINRNDPHTFEVHDFGEEKTSEEVQNEALHPLIEELSRDHDTEAQIDDLTEKMNQVIRAVNKLLRP